VSGTVAEEGKDAIHSPDFIEGGLAGGDQVDVAVVVEVAQCDPERHVHRNDAVDRAAPLWSGFLDEDLGAQGGRARRHVEFAVSVDVTDRNPLVQPMNIRCRHPFRGLTPATLAVPEPHARPGGVRGDDIKVAIAIDVGHLHRLPPLVAGQSFGAFLPDPLAVALEGSDPLVRGGDHGEIQAAVVIEIAHRDVFGADGRQPR